MTKTFAQATSFVLAALVTVATVAGVNGLAAQQYQAASQIVTARSTALQNVAVQNVVVVGHRVAKA